MKRRTDQGGSLSLNKEVEDGAWKAEKEEVGGYWTGLSCPVGKTNVGDHNVEKALL